MRRRVVVDRGTQPTDIETTAVSDELLTYGFSAAREGRDAVAFQAELRVAAIVVADFMLHDDRAVVERIEYDVRQRQFEARVDDFIERNPGRFDDIRERRRRTPEEMRTLFRIAGNRYPVGQRGGVVLEPIELIEDAQDWLALEKSRAQDRRRRVR